MGNAESADTQKTVSKAAAVETKKVCGRKPSAAFRLRENFNR